ncbi:MAG: hypothetical protein WB564_01290 [Dehalococcoidia bacterium]
MSPKKQGNDKILAKQIREAIQRSGYLIEQRVEPIIRQSFGYVQTNPIYKDPDTDKSCELDISGLSASILDENKPSCIFPMLLCECENNSQPIVFFTTESFIPYLLRDDLKVSGIPVKFWDSDKNRYTNFADFIGMEEFHHYCETKIATQYCTFQKKKEKEKPTWIALHSEEQHDTFNKLIKGIDYEIAKHFGSYRLPDEVSKEYVNVQIYYPLIILQGDLYSACLSNNRLILKKEKHLKFSKQFFPLHKNEPETYQIDVIVESYLPKYLKMIEAEVDKISKIFQQKKDLVSLSIQKIVDDIGKAGVDLSLYRNYLEL